MAELFRWVNSYNSPRCRKQISVSSCNWHFFQCLQSTYCIRQVSLKLGDPWNRSWFSVVAVLEIWWNEICPKVTCVFFPGFSHQKYQIKWPNLDNFLLVGDLEHEFDFPIGNFIPTDKVMVFQRGFVNHQPSGNFGWISMAQVAESAGRRSRCRRGASRLFSAWGVLGISHGGIMFFGQSTIK